MSRLAVTVPQQIVPETSALVRQVSSTPSKLENRSAWCHELRSKDRTSVPYSEWIDPDDSQRFEAIAAEAPQALFNSCSSMTEPEREFPAELWRAISLEYFLNDYENSLQWSADINLSLHDLRELLRAADEEPKETRSPYSRERLPGLMVIDCFSRCVVTAEPGCEYVALSYVWGLITSCSEDESFEPDLRGRRLPQTVEDAMNVVQVLGKRYLWVDRYCINSTEPGSKHFMISNMDAIYEAAYLTIIAASGADGEHGLPSVSGLCKALGESKVPPWNGLVYTKLSHLCLDSYVRLGQIETSIWSTRGWTYQEGLLSRRRLIFTDDYAILQYRGEDRVRASSGIFAHINEYTRRNLTYPSDSLNAFLGVLRAYERLQPAAMHVWGVPFLVRSDGAIRQPGYGLLWRANRGCSLRRVEGMPSWTWAGWTWSDHHASNRDFMSRQFPLGPYHWLVEKARLRGQTRSWPSWGPCDISLEVQVGPLLMDISDYFRKAHKLAPGWSIQPEPTLYLTAWTTTMTAYVSPTLPVYLQCGDMRTSIITLDQDVESLCAGKEQVNGRWVCEWTAALICWGRRFPTQSLVLERVGEDTFRRIGVLETEWLRPEPDRDSSSYILYRGFIRKRLCIV